MSNRTKRLAKIEARENATPKGPYKVNRFDNEGGEINWQVQQDVEPFEVIANITDDELKEARGVAAFMANARDDVPWLHGEVTAADAALEALGVPNDGRPIAERIKALAVFVADLHTDSTTTPSQLCAWLRGEHPEADDLHDVADPDAPISTRPGRCGGVPCVSGTRIPVAAIQSFGSVETAHAAYPHLRREQIEAALCGTTCRPKKKTSRTTYDHDDADVDGRGVRTDVRRGLTKEDVDAAVRILAR